MKWFLASIGGLIVVLVIVVVVVVLTGRGGSDTNLASKDNDVSGASVGSPYDLVEMRADTDFNALSKAAFLSIYVPDDAGNLTSYGVSSDLPAAQALTEAVQNGEAVDSAEAQAALDGDTTSTLTFVLPSRETVTFALYLEQGMIQREGRTWRPAGDLATLVQSAIKSPQ
jgi:hypothetical protein